MSWLGGCNEDSQDPQTASSRSRAPNIQTEARSDKERDRPPLARRASPTSGSWNRLPPPPELREGAEAVWAGRSTVLWGGCRRGPGSCRASATGFEFAVDEREWRRLPRAPSATLHSHGTWTGEEVIFVALHQHSFNSAAGSRAGLAYDPTTRSWRETAPAPLKLHTDSSSVWTGSELLVWGGGRRGSDAAIRGAAYQPRTDTWRVIASSPIGLNAISAAWTGEEAIFFGSLLNVNNRAPTPKAVGIAYDPIADSWRRLPRSSLSPQASSTAWVGSTLIAWDYVLRSQEYDPASDQWSAPQRVPLRSSECYPDSAALNGVVFAFYCGTAALYDVGKSSWRRIGGGPLRTEIASGAGSMKLWRFAELVAAENSVYLLAEGITVSRSGEACYHCAGSPLSFWVYRPPQRSQ